MQIKNAFPQLLFDISFRRYWTGQTISLVGDQLTSLALPLTAVLFFHASAWEMGLLTAVGWLPYLLIGIHAGSWVDSRGQRRKIMIVADIARAILLFAIPITYLLGLLSIPFLLIDSFIIGIFTVLFNVSSSTLFVSIVPQERYVEANSLLNGSRAVSFQAGPSIGGFLIQLISAPITFIVDGLSFLASSLLLSRIRVEEPHPVKVQPGHISAGLRFIWSNSIMRFSLVSIAMINLFNYVFSALFVLYVTRILHVSPGYLGLILGLGAFGSVFGSFVTSGISKRIGIGYTLLLGSILFPLPLILVPLAGGPHYLVLILLFLSEFFSGIGLMALDISSGSIQTAIIPNEIRARVSGAWSFINNGIRPLGALLGGMLPTFCGIHGAMWIGTVGACFGFLWLLPSGITKFRDVGDFVKREKGREKGTGPSL